MAVAFQEDFEAVRSMAEQMIFKRHPPTVDRAATPIDVDVDRGASLSGGHDASHGSSLDGSGVDGSGLDGSGLDGSGLDGSGLNGSGLDGSGLDGSGLNGSGLDGSGLDGSGLDGSGLNGSGLNGSGVNVDNSEQQQQQQQQQCSSVDDSDRVSSRSQLKSPLECGFVLTKTKPAVFYKILSDKDFEKRKKARQEKLRKAAVEIAQLEARRSAEEKQRSRLRELERKERKLRAQMMEELQLLWAKGYVFQSAEQVDLYLQGERGIDPEENDIRKRLFHGCFYEFSHRVNLGRQIPTYVCRQRSTILETVTWTPQEVKLYFECMAKHRIPIYGTTSSDYSSCQRLLSATPISGTSVYPPIWPFKGHATGGLTASNASQPLSMGSPNNVNDRQQPQTASGTDPPGVIAIAGNVEPSRRSRTELNSNDSTVTNGDSRNSKNANFKNVFEQKIRNHNHHHHHNGMKLPDVDFVNELLKDNFTQDTEKLDAPDNSDNNNNNNMEFDLYHDL